jgi:hypothetical protein
MPGAELVRAERNIASSQSVRVTGKAGPIKRQHYPGLFSNVSEVLTKHKQSIHCFNRRIAIRQVLM